MPGFIINSTGGTDGVGANASVQIYSDYRFRCDNFFGQKGDDPSNPWIYLKDVEMPSKIMEELTIKAPGATYKFAKSVNYTDLKLVFYATETFFSSLETQMASVHSITTGINDFNTYMNTVVLTLSTYIPEDQAGEDTIFTFNNAYISDTQYGSLSFGSSEIKQATVVVKYSHYVASTSAAS